MNMFAWMIPLDLHLFQFFSSLRTISSVTIVSVRTSQRRVRDCAMEPVWLLLLWRGEFDLYCLIAQPQPSNTTCRSAVSSYLHIAFIHFPPSVSVTASITCWNTHIRLVNRIKTHTHTFSVTLVLFLINTYTVCATYG